MSVNVFSWLSLSIYFFPPAIFPIRRSFSSLGKQVKEADGNQTVVDPIRDPLERCQSTAEFQ